MTSKPNDSAAAKSTTDDGIATLPDPAILKNLATEYPVPEGFNADEYYADTKYNGWYPILENYVDTIRDECQTYSSMHAEASKLYNKRYQLITISLIVIPLLSGIVAYLPLPQTLAKVVIGILALIGVALGAFNKAMLFGETSYIHRIASDKFMKLNGTIAEQVFLPFDKRYNGVKFERWCRITFFSIKELAPYPEKKRGKRIVSPTTTRPGVPPPASEVPQVQRVMISHWIKFIPMNKRKRSQSTGNIYRKCGQSRIPCGSWYRLKCRVTYKGRCLSFIRCLMSKMAPFTIASHKGYSINKSNLTVAELSDLKKELTATPQAHPDYPFVSSFPVYEDGKKWIRVPRWYGICRFGMPAVDKLVDFPLREDVCVFAGTLRENQIQPHDTFLSALTEKKMGLLCVSTGFGKSFTLPFSVVETASKNMCPDTQVTIAATMACGNQEFFA